jgi:hypothetical protein
MKPDGVIALVQPVAAHILRSIGPVAPCGLRAFFSACWPSSKAIHSRKAIKQQGMMTRQTVVFIATPP